MPPKPGLAATSPLTNISGIGPHYQKALSRLNLTTVRDLLNHYPTRYLDYQKPVTIRELKEGQNVSFAAAINQPSHFKSKSGLFIVQAEAKDHSGKIKLTWFNSPFIAKLIKPGQTYMIAGKTSVFGGKITLVSPLIEPGGSHSLHTSGLVPIYPLTAGLTSRFLRQKISLVLKKISPKDPLSPKIIKPLGLGSYPESLSKIHFPRSKEEKLTADKRLSFNSHLAINIKNILSFKKSPFSESVSINETLHQKTLEKLPFQLTPSQLQAIKDTYKDIKSNQFTHRLIQGETGSGKTVVVFFLARQVIDSKKSFCLLAPTGILANQHYQTFIKLGLPKNQIKLVTAGNPIKKISQKPIIYIGTHALINQIPQNLKSPLAIVVVDEQHKFGVDQRNALTNRTPTPHLINLTATPIPRTLALGLFGEVNITTLIHKPNNRLPTKTWIVDPARFTKSNPWITKQLKNGSKIFVVAPLIHESSKLSANSAKDLFKNYQKKFKETTHLHLIHGQMKPNQIETEIENFKKNKGGILITTSIIEVGIDIPEADVIIIHSAERFGLASLHQLRGRVGRGNQKSYCLLVPTNNEQTEIERLKLLAKHTSGLILSKMDLRLRGAGELFGEKQHGFIPVRLKFFWNISLFRKAKELAQQIIDQNPNEATAIADNLLTW